MHKELKKVTLTRNYSVDTLKLLCAFLVVLIHVPSDWKAAVLPLTRVAVPIFFMISGYFIYTDDCKKFDTKLKKTFTKILLITCLGFTFYSINALLFDSVSLSDLFSDTQSTPLESAIKLFLFNYPVENFLILWYLLAFLYTLAVFIVANRFITFKLLLPIIIILLTITSIVTYLEYPLTDTYSNYLVMNWLLFGIPFFSIGIYVRQKSNYLLHINKNILFFAIALFIITTYIESTLAPINYELYISSILLGVSLFLASLNIHQRKDNFLSICGRKYSALIYLIHTLLINKLFSILAVSGLLNLAPVINFIISLGTSMGLYALFSFLQRICYKKVIL